MCGIMTGTDNLTMFVWLLVWRHWRIYAVIIHDLKKHICCRENSNQLFAIEIWRLVCNLVDPASSHMLVSKIKPCMCQYRLLYGETANGSLKQLLFIWSSLITWISVEILELIHAHLPNLLEGLCLLDTEPTQALPGFTVNHNDWTNRIASAGDKSFKFLTYQLSTVGYRPTVAMTGNGELGFDSGEGAWETATTSKEGSRRANYPILA